VTDGDLSKGIDVRSAVSGQPGYLQLEFTEPIQAQAIAVYGVAVGASGSSSAAESAVEASDDGVSYRSVCEIHVPSTGGVSDIPGTESFPAVSLRYLRLVMRQPSRISQVRISAGARIRGWHYKNNSASRGGPGQATAPPPGFTAGVASRFHHRPRRRFSIFAVYESPGPPAVGRPRSNWTILRMGHTPTGRHNASAPDGGLGLDCDKYSRAGIDFHFHYMFDKILPMLRPLVAKGMAGSLIDSYEVGMQNWTREFPREFQRRCGYDLRRYMPAMTDGWWAAPRSPNVFCGTSAARRPT